MRFQAITLPYALSLLWLLPKSLHFAKISLQEHCLGIAGSLIHVDFFLLRRVVYLFFF